MAEPLKTFFNPALVNRLAADVSRVDPSFPVKAFVKDATRGLDALELLDRARHISRALAAHLPADYPSAIDILLRSLGREHATDELLGVGMEVFYYMPHVLFVADRGLDHFDLSMRAQYELTKRFSAETSIRPFIARYPERTFRILDRWIRDPNPHVRRLVSEGTRMRLPWAMRVPWLDANPDRVLALLRRLKDDPAALVRRSVANNLNDLGKVHPDLLVRTCQMWLTGASEERRALIEHALRSAVKRGHPGALRLLGYGRKASVAVKKVRFEPRRVTIGGRVIVSFVVKNTATSSQDVLVDLIVHFVKATGRTSRKVFKVTRATLRRGEAMTLRKTISLGVHTTRVPQPGRHAVEVAVNGEVRKLGSFQVVTR